MSKWVKPGSMGKVAPGYDVRIVNNMGKVTSMSSLEWLYLSFVRIVARRCREVSRVT